MLGSACLASPCWACWAHVTMAASSQALQTKAHRNAWWCVFVCRWRHGRRSGTVHMGNNQSRGNHCWGNNESGCGRQQVMQWVSGERGQLVQWGSQFNGNIAMVVLDLFHFRVCSYVYSRFLGLSGRFFGRGDPDLGWRFNDSSSLFRCADRL